MLLSVPSTVLPAVSSAMSLASSPSISEGYTSSPAALETVYPTLASGCSVACSVTLADCPVVMCLPGSTVTTAVPFSTSSVNASTNAIVHSAKQTVADQDTLTCPVCFKKFAPSASNVLWRHINTDHISQCCFSSANFFALHSRLICSVGACRWTSHHFQHSGCQHKLSTGSPFRGALVEASTVADLLSAPQFPENDVQHEAMDSSHISSHVPDLSLTHSELISIAIEATETLHL